MVFLGSVIRIQNTITDFDGTSLTPDSQEIKIYDPDGTLKTTDTSPTLEETGVYYVQYDIDSSDKAGTWKVVWKVTKSLKSSVEVFVFLVEAT